MGFLSSFSTYTTQVNEFNYNSISCFILLYDFYINFCRSFYYLWQTKVLIFTSIYLFKQLSLTLFYEFTARVWKKTYYFSKEHCFLIHFFPRKKCWSDVDEMWMHTKVMIMLKSIFLVFQTNLSSAPSTFGYRIKFVWYIYMVERNITVRTTKWFWSDAILQTNMLKLW